MFANALGGENRNMSNIRVWRITPNLAKQHGLPDANSQAFTEAILEARLVSMKTRCPENWQTSFRSCCQPVGFARSNHAMDAACASSMAAVLDACRLLQTRQVDVMLAGATDRTMDPATFANFPPSGRSPSHSSPLMHEPTAS